MRKQLMLGSVIEKFIKNHPKYMPNLWDIDVCVHYIAENFARIVASTNSATYKLRNQICIYEHEIQKLREENEKLKERRKK